LKILAGWESEWLAHQWNPGSQVLLIHKDGICVQRVEPLLLWKELQPGSSGGRIAISSGRLNTLERIGRIQIKETLCDRCRRVRRSRGWVAGRSAEQDDLWRLRAIGNIGIKAEGQQRMVIEHAVRSSDHRFAIVVRIPRQSNARRDVVIVTRNALRDAQRIL